jgi:hypothetical protein
VASGRGWCNSSETRRSRWTQTASRAPCAVPPWEGRPTMGASRSGRPGWQRSPTRRSSRRMWRGWNLGPTSVGRLAGPSGIRRASRWREISSSRNQEALYRPSPALRAWTRTCRGRALAAGQPITTRKVPSQDPQGFPPVSKHEPSGATEPAREARGDSSRTPKLAGSGELGSTCGW